MLEIGAGLGRVAFFASKLGIKNYTIIDIPLTSLAQSYFLGTVLGDEAISLFGEEERGIRILPPSAFLDGTETYDLILNADSFPEIDLETSGRYVQAIARRSKQFLSINHEGGGVPVRFQFQTPPTYRFPYWLRRGYIEELFSF